MIRADLPAVIPRRDALGDELRVPLRVDVAAAEDGHHRAVRRQLGRVGQPRRERSSRPTARRPAGPRAAAATIARRMSISDTVSTPSSICRQVPEGERAQRVRCACRPPPSGRPAPRSQRTMWPSRSDSAASAASSGSTPKTRASGRSDLTAVATPDASPPPPTGTSTVNGRRRRSPGPPAAPRSPGRRCPGPR